MKPREILQKIIDNRGQCTWINDISGPKICINCPLGQKQSCLTYVFKSQGGINTGSFLEAAIQALNDIEIERVVLGKEDDK